MYAVFLAFSKEHPHPEDEAIKAYLDAHELIPKVQGTDTFEDQEFAHSTEFSGWEMQVHPDSPLRSGFAG